MLWKLLKKIAFQPEPAPDSFPRKRIAIQLPLNFLEKLIPIGDLPSADLQSLSITARSFEVGEIVFHRGELADELIYLHQGEVFLESPEGYGYSVADSVFKACYPLSGQLEHQFTAIAKTSVQVIYIASSALKRSTAAAQQRNPLLALDDLPDDLSKSALFLGFRQAYQNNQLHVPSLPDVALRLRRALQKDIDISDAAKIINLDPQIAAKLMQVANSPLYPSATRISNSHDAINRLGLKTTQNLVTSISLHNLFRSQNPRLHQFIQQLWKQSIHVASLSHTLAAISGKINPDEALLAGLIHNIGALPIVAFAETLPSNAYTEQQLSQLIHLTHSRVAQSILENWNFPESLQNIPHQTSYWYHDANIDLQLSDIVLLARFHHLMGSNHASQLPPLNTLPAFIKLDHKTLTPDLSLHILQEAKQQISEALSFFK